MLDHALDATEVLTDEREHEPLDAQDEKNRHTAEQGPWKVRLPYPEDHAVGTERPGRQRAHGTEDHSRPLDRLWPEAREHVKRNACEPERRIARAPLAWRVPDVDLDDGRTGREDDGLRELLPPDRAQHRLERFPAVGIERTPEVGDPNPGEAPQHAVDEAGRQRPPPRVLTNRSAPARDVPARIDCFDEARDVLGRVLQVAVHGHDDVTARTHDSCVHGGMLTEVPLQTHGVNPRIGVVESLERRKGPIGGTVVDEDELERPAQSVERGGCAPVQLVDRRGLVEQRYDDGDVWPPFVLGHSRRCPQDVKLLHRRAPAYTRRLGKMAWQPGATIVRREVLCGRPWLGTIVVVVADEPELLASYLPEGAPFDFPNGRWPTQNGRHPWHGRRAWQGHGVLMLQRPGERYAVWHFWDGREREFAGWYLNLQEPFRRTSIGYDTQDLELDVWIPANGDGSWSFKDDDVLEDRVSEGRFTAAEIEEIRAEGARIGAMLDAGNRWWDTGWSHWSPPPDCGPKALPEGWDVV